MLIQGNQRREGGLPCFPHRERVFDLEARGDLGYNPNQPQPSDSYSIKYQIEKVWNEIRAGNKRLFYKIAKLEHILTGWNPPKRKYFKQSDYSPTNKADFPFQKCYPEGGKEWGVNLLQRIGIGCIYGGRTGYSVKMVSHCSLENNPYIINKPSTSVRWEDRDCVDPQ